MCLGIPVRIEKIDGMTATASLSGVKRQIGIELTPDVRVGDYVLLHAGFSIQKIREHEARQTLRLLAEMQDLSAETKSAAGPRRRRSAGGGDAVRR